MKKSAWIVCLLSLALLLTGCVSAPVRPGNETVVSPATPTVKPAPVLSPGATVAEGAYGENLTWLIDTNGTLFIRGTGQMTYYDYDSRGDLRPWINYEAQVRSVVIEKGVTSIASHAFCFCEEITSVTIADSVTEIGDFAFAHCYSLMSVTIPGSVTSIDSHAFFACDSLTSVTIPGSVECIYDDTFNGCTGLTRVTILDGVEYILQDAFEGCGSLTSVTIPGSVTYIDHGAFYACDSLTDVYYSGSEAQWSEIYIETRYNDSLLNARIHFNAG